MKRRPALHSRGAWPPVMLVAFWVGLYGSLHAIVWLLETMIPGPREAFWDVPEIANMRKGILALAAGSYAVYRLCRFHPACSQGYAAWLKLSPWNPKQPLPYGPVHPVWQDGVVVGVLVVIAHWHAHVNAALPAIWYGLVYLAGMTLLLIYTRRWKSSIALGFLWPAIILPAAKGWPMIVLIGIAGVVWHGHRKSLEAFPWDFLPTRPRVRSSPVLQIDLSIPILSSQLRTSDVGWPLVALSPKFRPPSIPFATGICVSLLFGWWLYCIVVRPGVDPFPEIILIFAIFAAVMRLAFYCGGVVNSFNVWGRITSGRLLVPGYDRVFVTPLATILVALVGDILLRRAELSSSAASISCLGVVVAFMLLCGGPTLRTWILTGQHRYQPPSRLVTTRQVLKPI